MNDIIIESKEILKALDEKNIAKFISAFQENATFRFGSQDVVNGRANIQEYVSGFLDSTVSMEHKIEDSFHNGDFLIIKGTVFYHMKSGIKKLLPFCDIWKINLQGKISDYCIYCDPTGLF